MTSRARSRRSAQTAAMISTRISTTMDAAIASVAEERDITFSEATRQLLELGLVALAAVKKEKPTGPYRFTTVPAHDAGDTDEPLLTPDES